ncbi:MAG: glucosaminidase domain-containing protein [Stackebrandtia sp.]
MHIDIPQVRTVGQRIGRLGSDAESFLLSVDGSLRQATSANNGFSAVKQLGQVLDILGKQLGGLIDDTGIAARDVDTAAQTHAATEERSRGAMSTLNQQLPSATPGESLGQRGGETTSGTDTEAGNPLREMLNPSGGQDAAAAGSEAPTDAAVPAPDGANQSREQFVESVGTAAKGGQERFGVPASVASAQAILESGWGKSGLATEANNFFGIKCADGDPGSTASSCVNYKTWEVVAGNDTTVRDAFRSYDSASDSFLDHGQFLQENPRYAEAFNHSDDPDQFIREVANAGYATDPDYADKIIDIMQKNDLYRFDN